MNEVALGPLAAPNVTFPHEMCTFSDDAGILRVVN